MATSEYLIRKDYSPIQAGIGAGVLTGSTYVLFMSDSQLKNYLGWTQSSKMAGIYVHMSGKDADDAILQANNIVVEKVKKDPALKPVQCLRCKGKNPATNRFCNSCGFSLDEQAAREVLVQENTKKDIDQVMNKLMQDQDVLAIIQRKLQEMKNV